jgi:hypothetical protein
MSSTPYLLRRVGAIPTVAGGVHAGRVGSARFRRRRKQRLCPTNAKGLVGK